MDAGAIDAMHARRGFRAVYRGQVYHIGYHYVVLQDGTVQRGRPEGCVGAHARHLNDRSLGVCLVGNFSSADNPAGRQGPVRPPDAQIASLTALCAYLVRKYDIPLEQIRRHRDVGRTACPGDQFPWNDFRRALRRELGMAEE